MTADIHDIYLNSSSQLTTIIRLAKGTRALINFVVRWSIHNLPRDNWGERPAWGPLNSCFPRLELQPNGSTDTFNWKTLWTNQKTLILSLRHNTKSLNFLPIIFKLVKNSSRWQKRFWRENSKHSRVSCLQEIGNSKNFIKGKSE